MGVLFYNRCRVKTGVFDDILLSVTEADEKDVNFYDYDGFRLLSYTNAEALALASLPNNPVVNENLTFEGWNWTLQEIKTRINNVGDTVNVGAIYHTTDDKTHITCRPTSTYPQAHIRLTPTVANAVTVDWGDGTMDIWTNTLDMTKSHTYTGVTDSSVYDITISCTSGTYSFSSFIAGSNLDNKRCVYTDIKLSNKISSLENSCFGGCLSLKSVTIPGGVDIGGNCFNGSPLLQFVNIPSGVTTLNTSVFSGCYSLKSVTIPNSVTTIYDYCFTSCYSLQSITIPSGVTGFFYTNCFYNCYSLKSINIPSGITGFSDNCFYNCSSLQSINIPSGVTSFGACFPNCFSLQSITIPSGVTSLGACFTNCNSLRKIYMEPTTPPTISTSTIPNSNITIYVPTGSLSAYQNAANWSTYSSKIKGYNF